MAQVKKKRAILFLVNEVHNHTQIKQTNNSHIKRKEKKKDKEKKRKMGWFPQLED